MHNFSVSNSSSAKSITASISTTTTQYSQHGTADGQHPQGFFMGLLTTPHTSAEFTQILSTYHQQDELRLLSDISASQTDPLEVPATHQLVCFDDDDQGQSVNPLSLFNESSRSQKSSQSADDVLPIVSKEPSPDPSDKWIMMSGNKSRPYQCGYEGCGRRYSVKAHLQTHFVTHTGDLKLRCYLGDCTGTIYRNTQALTWHIHAHHTFERLYGCELCDRRFRLKHHLKRHKENVHFIKSKKKSQKPQSVSESSSATTTTHTTSTSVMTSGASQPESAAGQRQQSSRVGISTTINTPKSMQIPTDYQQLAALRVLAEVSTSQINPFEALAKHQTVTFDDDDQGQSASPLPLAIEPSRSQKSSQSVDDTAPIVREEQRLDPNDKWVMMSGDDKQPYQCGYEGCGRKYSIKVHLQTHFVTHTGDSKLRCYFGDCAGTIRYRSTHALTQHIHACHTFEKVFKCELCDRRFRLQHHLKRHEKNVHFIKSKKNSPRPLSVSESSSATTTTHTTSTSTMTSGVSQPESAAGQRRQGTYIGISTTINTPKSMQIPTDYQQQAALRVLAEVSTSQINPFEAPATPQTVTFDDDNQGQSASPLLLANEPSRSQKSSQSADDVLLMARKEQSPDPTDKWIKVDKSQKKPYKCGYPRGCSKSYLKRCHLIWHFASHTGKSKFKCPHPECVGNEYFSTKTSLKRHNVTHHTSERPFQCDSCSRRFGRKDYLKKHRKHIHGIEEERTSPKPKRK